MSGREKLRFDSIEGAIEDIKKGKMVIVLDDEDRENEGDLTIAASKITPPAINFMAKYGRGLICLAMTEKRLEELDIPPMVRKNTARYGTAFCVSIDAREGVTTGISAADRATTIRRAIDPDTKPDDLARPGHIFPLMAQGGGVLKRAGQTEAAVDLARLACLYPAGVICEMMSDDGTMARAEELIDFGKKHGLKVITIAELINYRMRKEKFVKRVASPRLPTRYGEFRLFGYVNELDGREHLALVMGDIKPEDEPLVRVHSQCLTGDVFKSSRCDCGVQLHMALEMIAKEGKGVLLYLRQEGRGIGLFNKLRAYELQDKGKDTVEANLCLGFKADERDYGVGAQILSDLGLKKIRVMTNNPRKFIALKGYGLEIVERVPLEAPPTDCNRDYLKAKKDKLGHIISSV
jgi:3,4-dihydroxy 2-butanone 4-phosphate synthase/GTP cyclohydrolase II